MQRDPVQALGLATLLLCFCQADADATLLGRQEVAAGAAQLLKVCVCLPGPLVGLVVGVSIAACSRCHDARCIFVFVSTAAIAHCLLRMPLLLQLSSSFETAAGGGGGAGSCAAGTKLLALLKERPYSLQVRALAAPGC